MEHQDWKTYIIHAKNPIKEDKEKKETTKKISSNVNLSKKMDQKIEEGNLKHKKIDPNLSKEIQQKRISKGLTQKDLAKRLSIPVQTINEMECGKYLYNGKQISIIKRFLKI